MNENEKIIIRSMIDHLDKVMQLSNLLHEKTTADILRQWQEAGLQFQFYDLTDLRRVLLAALKNGKSQKVPEKEAIHG